MISSKVGSVLLLSTDASSISTVGFLRLLLCSSLMLVHGRSRWGRGTLHRSYVFSPCKDFKPTKSV